MNKKVISVVLVSYLLFAAYTEIAWAHPPNSTDPTHFVKDTMFEPESLDPAWAYDMASSEVIQNVYEPLVFYDRDYTLDPYMTGKMDSFIPKLAVSWSIMPLVPAEPSPEGLLWYWRYIFTIRTNVKWHDPAYGTVIPEDVEYSFERLMVQDRAGGPPWLIYQPLLNVYNAVDPATDPLWGLKIDHSVESDATSIWFNLASLSVQQNEFLKTLGYTVGTVVNKLWCQQRGDLNVESVPGGWSDWAYIWNTWHDPPVSFIEGDMMGTGPYKFDYWSLGVSYSIVKFDDYWDDWPARVSDNPSSPLYNERLVSFVKRVTWFVIPDWITRQARFLAGQSDQTVVPKSKTIYDMLLSSPGIRCFFPIDQLLVNVMIYNFFIVKAPLPVNTFDESGFPPNFFGKNTTSGIDEGEKVRKAFDYSFDYTAYIESVYIDGEQPACPVPKPLYYDPTDPKYSFDSTQAIAYFQRAWGGELWQTGFTLPIYYPTGDASRQFVALQLEAAIESYNPRFHIDPIALLWGSGYLPKLVNKELPIVTWTWWADPPSLADPYYAFYDHMHSQGNWPSWQSYSNPAMDAAIEARDYNLAQDIYFADAPSVPLVNSQERYWERDWMRGWYYNPLYQGEYAYHRWKAVTHFGDVNNDGAVDILDVGLVSAHWYPGPPVGPLGFNPKADINGGTGGVVCGGSGPVIGIPDGRVDLLDAALISAYWDGPPPGPSHP